MSSTIGNKYKPVEIVKTFVASPEGVVAVTVTGEIYFLDKNAGLISVDFWEISEAHSESRGLPTAKFSN